MPLNKPVAFTAPLDQKAVALELFLASVARDTLKSASGAYVGDGTTPRSINVGFSPLLIIISLAPNASKATFPVSGDMVFSLASNAGVSYVPGSGYIKTGVLSFTSTGVTVGNDVNVNASGSSFVYFAVG